jgi:inhibitor of cysteine peptidase
MLVIDQAQNNGTFELQVGDSFRIELPENPTTGYRWQLPSPQTLRILEDSFATSTAAPGSGGVRHWTLAADTPAVIALRLELRRSWEKQAVETFDATITVKAR